MKRNLVRDLFFSAITIAIGIHTTSGCVAQGTPTQDPPPVTERSTTQTDDKTSAQAGDEGLMDPSKATATAPEKFRVKVKTSKGDMVIEVTRAWAPNGADRFYNMVKVGYFKDIAIFRAIRGFMFQFGIHGDPKISEAWSEANIIDDPKAGISNLPGTLTFAQTGNPNSRSVQMFINLGDNSGLDNPRSGSPFIPFGKVVEGMNVIEKINTEYGENKPADSVQANFKIQGNAFIKKKFPNADYIKSIELIEDKKDE